MSAFASPIAPSVAEMAILPSSPRSRADANSGTLDEGADSTSVKRMETSTKPHGDFADLAKVADFASFIPRSDRQNALRAIAIRLFFTLDSHRWALTSVANPSDRSSLFPTETQRVRQSADGVNLKPLRPQAVPTLAEVIYATA